MLTDVWPADGFFPEALCDPLREVHVAPHGGAGGCGCLDVEESLDLTLGVLHTQTLQGLVCCFLNNALS